MTDGERQKLVEDLRRIASPDRSVNVPICAVAAREMERLAADVEHWKMIANRAYIDPKPLTRSDAEPSIGEDAVDAAFDKFMEGREYKQSGNRLFFHAGVEFGLRHANCALAQSDAEPVRPAWVEPNDNYEGPYVLCIETPAQVKIFEIEAEHFADALAKAINEHVKLYTAPPRPDASAELIEAFRKNAKECYQAYRESHDPAEGAAADAYNECADALVADRSGK